MLETSRYSVRGGGPLIPSRLEVVVRLSLYTGLRRAEICWLTWDDVDLTGGWVHVRAKDWWTPKASDERSAPITDESLDFILRTS